jgi:hypothetical protein
LSAGALSAAALALPHRVWLGDLGDSYGRRADDSRNADIEAGQSRARLERGGSTLPLPLRARADEVME